MSKKIFAFSHGFYGIWCSEYNQILLKSYDLPPCKFEKSKLQKKTGNLIMPIYFSQSVWSSLTSFWKRHSFSVSVAFYEPSLDKIFLNVNKLGINVTKDCGIPTTTSSSVLRKTSEVVAHEITHYVFNHKTSQVYSFCKPVLKRFYTQYWDDIIDGSILAPLVNAHMSISTLIDKTSLDIYVGSVNYKLLQRFLRILDKIRRDHQTKILNIKKFEETINIINSTLQGQYLQTDILSENFKTAYRKAYDSYPVSILFGQELIFASEILAIAANIRTSKALTITKKILSYL